LAGSLGTAADVGDTSAGPARWRDLAAAPTRRTSRTANVHKPAMTAQ
jgi:hypothetical protein